MLARFSRLFPQTRREVVARGVALAALALSACSFVVDTNADQCSSNADCQAKGAAFAGMVCSAEKVCVKPTGGDAGAGGSGGSAGSGDAGTGGDAGGGGAGSGGGGGAGSGGAPGCTTNQQCADQLGELHVCRKTDGQCVKLISTECTRVEGDYKNDNAVFVGSILPVLGSDASNGVPNENSIFLAIRDINGAGGLPPTKPGGPSRPLVGVGCNDGSDSNTAVVAAKHLVDNVKVPAIVGAAFSGISIKVATQVTIPSGVFQISPSATSVAITDLVDNGLLWRTSPSDAFQASAIAKLMPYLEQKVRAAAKVAPADPIRVAIFNKGDSYGSGLAEALQEKLSFNGKLALENGNNFLRFDYGDPDDPQAKPTKYPEALVKAFDFKPHLLFVFGTNESITEVFSKVEEGWTAQAKAEFRPQYVFADGGFIPEVWNSAKAIEDAQKITVADRILGTIPGTTNLNFKAFASLYKSQFTEGSPDVFGCAGGYDAVYLLAYAMASLGETPLTGAAIAGGFSKLVPGPSIPAIKVGSSQLSKAFGLLTAGQGIDFDGASGPLNFDIKTGEAPSDIQFWCTPKGPDGKASAGITSGSYYDAAKDSAEATDSIATSCNF